MEMKPGKLGRKMYQQISGADMPDRKTANEILKFIDGRIWIFEAYGTTKAERVLEVFRYARRRYGVTHFIVDSLAKCGFGEDDYNGQKDFVDRLMEFAGEFNVHVHLVVHIRKLADESKIPGKMDVKGTGAITDMVDNVFIVWRNKPKEEQFQIDGISHPEQPDTVLNCVKQRETGEEPMTYLGFHRPSCQFLGELDDPPKEYLFLEQNR
jgi:twinkle protein